MRPSKPLPKYIHGLKMLLQNMEQLKETNIHGYLKLKAILYFLLNDIIKIKYETNMII